MSTLTWITEKGQKKKGAKKRPISLEDKLESFKAAVRKRRNANKVKMSGSEKKSEQEHIVLPFLLGNSLS